MGKDGFKSQVGYHKERIDLDKLGIDYWSNEYIEDYFVCTFFFFLKSYTGIIKESNIWRGTGIIFMGRDCVYYKFSGIESVNKKKESSI